MNNEAGCPGFVEKLGEGNGPLVPSRDLIDAQEGACPQGRWSVTQRAESTSPQVGFEPTTLRLIAGCSTLHQLARGSHRATPRRQAEVVQSRRRGNTTTIRCQDEIP